MPVKQVMRWQTSDGKEFDQEEDALAHEAYVLRRIELAAVVEEAWSRYDPDPDAVIDALLSNFIFTRKED